MTTLALKTNVANKVIASAQEILGSLELRSGRYWYKGQQNCDLVVFQKGDATIIHASGGVRFRIAIKAKGSESSGTLSLLGWLRETPNAIRIVTTLLASHAKEISRRREMRKALVMEAEAASAELPLMTEAIGGHFSIKADEEKLEEKDRISLAESDKNYAMAVKSRWYHQGFVNFCRDHDIKCYYRSVFSEIELDQGDDREEMPLSLAMTSVH